MIPVKEIFVVHQTVGVAQVQNLERMNQANQSKTRTPLYRSFDNSFFGQIIRVQNRTISLGVKFENVNMN